MEDESQEKERSSGQKILNKSSNRCVLNNQPEHGYLICGTGGMGYHKVPREEKEGG